MGTYPPPENEVPEKLEEVRSDYPGMQVRTMWSRGDRPAPTERHLLRWETLGRNRDRPRDEAPPPSELHLYRMEVE